LQEKKVKASNWKVLTLLLLMIVPLVCQAQCPTAVTGCGQAVPHLVRFSGVLRNAAGIAHTGVVAIRFVIYGESTNGTPLWQEVQNVQLDGQGHYEVMLGSTGDEGIPMDLFSSGEPRWLGVEALLPGEDEQPRVLLVSVPYAMRAGDAATLGGLPASAYAKASNGSPVLSVPAPEPTSGNTPATATSLGVTLSSTVTDSALAGATGALNTVPKFSGPTSLVNSQITDINGMVSMQNLSNILFADRFPGGVSAAIAACPANGCIIYAVSPNVNLNLGNIDPGFKAITIYLGPYTYTVNQIMLRKGLKIIGMGGSASPSGTVACTIAAPCSGTALQSVNGNNPVFVIPQTNNQPAMNVVLSGFRLYGAAGNTSEDGFLLDTGSTVNSGLTNALFQDVVVQGFAGIGIHVKGRLNDFAAGSQWLLFDNVVVQRPSGGGNAVRLEGAVFEVRFRNCNFDGQGRGDERISTLVADLGAALPDIRLKGSYLNEPFAVQIDGGVDLTFYGSHHEELSAGYQVTSNTGIYTLGLTITDSYFAGNVGVNGGAGYALNVATTLAQGVYFSHNRLVGIPDAIVKGTNIASVVYQDNLFCDTCNGPPTSGITTQVAPAATINIRGVHSVGLNASTTPINPIQSSLGPGEMVTFFTWYVPATLASGGNINLLGASTLVVNGSVTLMRIDLGGSQWIPVAQWSSSTPQSVAVAKN
jgi:hypothetical protein